MKNFDHLFSAPKNKSHYEHFICSLLADATVTLAYWEINNLLPHMCTFLLKAFLSVAHSTYLLVTNGGKACQLWELGTFCSLFQVETDRPSQIIWQVKIFLVSAKLLHLTLSYIY